MQENAPQPETQSIPPDESPAASSPPVRTKTWQRRLLSVCYAIFTFEIGLFLVVFPWLDAWNVNYFQGLGRMLPNVWESGYFRGAMTGLGFVNIYIALLEVLRLLRRQ